MIEKILGVACLMSAGAMHTVERLASKSSAFASFDSENPYAVLLTIIGGVLLVAGYGRAVKDWLSRVLGDTEAWSTPDSSYRSESED